MLEALTTGNRILGGNIRHRNQMRSINRCLLHRLLDTKESANSATDVFAP